MVQSNSINPYFKGDWTTASLDSGSTTDIWTFKDGKGDVQGVITITYTDSTKGTISTVVKE